VVAFCLPRWMTRIWDVPMMARARVVPAMRTASPASGNRSGIIVLATTRRKKDEIMT